MGPAFVHPPSRWRNRVAARTRRRSVPAAPAGPGKLEKALEAIEPDDMTPREALEALYRLKGIAG